MFIRAMDMARGLRPGVIFPGDNFKTEISILVRTLTAVNLCEPTSYCSIKKLEVNQKISQIVLDRKDYLDRTVIHILKKDIQVFELPLMMNKKLSLAYLSKSWKRLNIPDEIKVLRWNPDEDQLIQNNMENLMGELRSKKNRDVFLNNLFSPSDKKYHKEKINIVGSYLGQGMKDPRLPCEIFHRACKLLSNECGQKIIFTEEDDKRIVNYLKNNRDTDKTPFVSLSKLLGYPPSTIHLRYKRILQQQGDKRKSGAFTAIEDQEILTAVFQDKKDALDQSYLPSDPLWDQLGRKLNRQPFGIYQHWEMVIRANLLLYEHGMENVDFRAILVDYFIEKNIQFRNETNWSAIMEDERFKGTTPFYLQRQYCNLVGKVRKKYPEIEDDEITSQFLKSYLDGIGKRQNKIEKGGFSTLIQDYVSMKEKL